MLTFFLNFVELFLSHVSVEVSSDDTSRASQSLLSFMKTTCSFLPSAFSLNEQPSWSTPSVSVFHICAATFIAQTKKWEMGYSKTGFWGKDSFTVGQYLHFSYIRLTRPIHKFIYLGTFKRKAMEIQWRELFNQTPASKPLTDVQRRVFVYPGRSCQRARWRGNFSCCYSFPTYWEQICNRRRKKKKTFQEAMLNFFFFF